MNFSNRFSNFSRVFSKKLSWTKLGANINGEAVNDTLGSVISMNGAGNRVAMGAYQNDGNGNYSGHVRIFQWNGTAWTQMGVDIDGEAAEDESGSSISMNLVGDRVAIGAPKNDGSGTDRGHVRVYQWNGTAWTQMGVVDIDGEAAEDQSGSSVSMNAVGDRVAIGARLNNGASGTDRGHVRIYSWNGTAWTQLGADIDGEAAGDQSGSSVSINAIGDRVVIGAPYNDGNILNSGHFRIYEFNGNAWTKMGLDIDGEVYGDNSGSSVSINAIGDRVAIGASNNNGNGNFSGHVRIFQWNGTAWTQMGVDIDGEAAEDQSGSSVSINAIGDRVAIGARLNDGSGTDRGHVRVYQWNGTAWTQVGTDIEGEVNGDNSGSSVSINAVGDRVAIGAPYNDGGNFDNGCVRIYELKA